MTYEITNTDSNDTTNETPWDRLGASIDGKNKLLDSKTARNWQVDGSGALVETKASSALRFVEAERFLGAGGWQDDVRVTSILEGAIKQIDADRLVKIGQLDEQINNLKSRINDNNKSNIQAILDDLNNRKEALSSTLPLDNSEVLRRATGGVAEMLSDIERAEVEGSVNSVVLGDRLPWTMTVESHVTDGAVEDARTIFDGLNAHEGEPNAKDMYKVAFPMDKTYHEKDLELIGKTGAPDSRLGGMYYTREELKRAGVFFVNRVAGGEQPIFGVPIPDGEGGSFDVQDRSFLTKEEFELVYEYQQDNGYGLSGADPRDVQVDMIMSAANPVDRGPGIKVTGSLGAARMHKYGEVFSPFVDNGVKLTAGFEGALSEYGDEGPIDKRRINTLVAHLVNAHPDYPGLSEMNDDSAARDQRYISPGEFVDKYYISPTTEEEALASLQYGVPTDRQQKWLNAT